MRSSASLGWDALSRHAKQRSEPVDVQYSIGGIPQVLLRCVIACFHMSSTAFNGNGRRVLSKFVIVKFIYIYQYIANKTNRFACTTPKFAGAKQEVLQTVDFRTTARQGGPREGGSWRSRRMTPTGRMPGKRDGQHQTMQAGWVAHVQRRRPRPISEGNS